MILIDSSVWVDFFNPSPGRAGHELHRMIAASERVVLTGLIVSEVLQGLTRNVHDAELFLSKWELLEPTGIATYNRAAAMFRLARSRGLSITTIDSIIAAIALEHGANVFSIDKDFERIASLTGLRLYKPSIC